MQDRHRDQILVALIGYPHFLFPVMETETWMVEVIVQELIVEDLALANANKRVFMKTEFE